MQQFCQLICLDFMVHINFKPAKLLLSLFVIILSSCLKKETDNCVSYSEAPITEVTGSETGFINQPVNLTVSFGCFNGCGNFGRLETSQSNDTTIIKVIAKYSGCICTQDAPIRQTNYAFQSATAGTYFLKFSKLDGSFILKQVLIQ